MLAIRLLDRYHRRRLGEAVGAYDAAAELPCDRRADVLAQVVAAGPDLDEAVERVIADGVVAGEVVQHGRDAIPDRRLRVVQPAHDAPRVADVGDHRRATRLTGQQGRQHQHVENGHRKAVRLAQRAVVSPGGAQDSARNQQVVLTMHDPLRLTGRPARVGDRGRRVRVHFLEFAHGASGLEGLFPGLLREQHGLSGRSVTAGTADGQPRAGVLEDRLLLRRCKRAVDAHPHGPKSHRRVEQDHDAAVVRQAHRETVAGPQPKLDQRPCGTSGFAVEFRVGHSPVWRDQGDSMRFVVQGPLGRTAEIRSCITLLNHTNDQTFQIYQALRVERDGEVRCDA